MTTTNVFAAVLRWSFGRLPDESALAALPDVVDDGDRWQLTRRQ
jgi:hypothetical protein